MWRNLLKQIDDFTKEKLEELVKFGGNNSSELMEEVVKEVASRFIFVIEEGGDCYFSGKTQPKDYLRRRLFKVKVSISGWDDDTFEMAGEDHLEELNSVAQTVGAKLTIKEVGIGAHRSLAPGHMSQETFELIAALVDQQEDKVDKVELRAVEVWESCAVVQIDVFISLVKASKKWTVESLTIGQLGNGYPSNEEILTTLAKRAGHGQIGKLMVLLNIEEVAMANKEDVKAVWEITEKMGVEFYTMSNEELVLTRRCAGGRGVDDPKTTWEDVYQDVLKKICNP